MSVPFIGKQFTFRQPDGTEFNVRGWGDQHHAFFETLDGYTIVPDPQTGFYSYAGVTSDGDELVSTGVTATIPNPSISGLSRSIRVSRAAAKSRALESSSFPPGTSRWEARRRQQQLLTMQSINGVHPAPPKRQTVGSFVGLCLLIQFPDVAGTIPQAEVDRFCNQEGYSGFGNNGSVRDYFLDVSGRRLDYRNIVTPYYMARHNRDYYANEQVPQPTRARQLIKEALGYFLAQGFDFSQLTEDSLDYVYATNVFYAGVRVNNWAKGLWPHSFHLQTPYRVADGKNAYDYQITDMTNELTLGTFCHENGHMICDFPDLYDYGYESSGVGAYCLMCTGANISEKNPTDVNPYLKYRAGWANQVLPVPANKTISLSAGSNDFLIHRKSAAEYYLIEVRHNADRDRALPSHGLAIWHVDELGDNQFEQMTSTNHYECALVQADGRNDLERDSSNIGDSTDLFGAGRNDSFGRKTNPKSTWWDGSASDLEITSISAPDRQMTMKV